MFLINILGFMLKSSIEMVSVFQAQFIGNKFNKDSIAAEVKTITIRENLQNLKNVA